MTEQPTEATPRAAAAAPTAGSTARSSAGPAPDVFVPMLGRVTEIVEMTARERFFRVELPRPLGHGPGQFVMLSILGVGEAPISISCGPRADHVLEMVVRKVGSLTQALHGLKPGATVGVRGPYGHGFDLADFEGRDVLFVCGGLGLAPLRSLIQPVVAAPERFGRVTVVSGYRSPAEELYRDEARAWAATPGVDVIRTVDATQSMPWDGEVGLVTRPIAKLDMDPARTAVALCGPPVMYKFVIFELGMRGVPTEQIFVDLERRMKCGVGKCGHCQINSATCCQEGPVFRFSSLAELPEALS